MPEARATFNTCDVVLTVEDLEETVRRAGEKRKRIIALEGTNEIVASAEYLQVLIDEEREKIAFEKALNKHNEGRKNKV